MAVRSMILRPILLSVVLLAFFCIPRLLFFSQSSHAILSSLTIYARPSTSTSTARVDDLSVGSHACDISSISNNTICCDRMDFKTDVCVMRGDILTNSSSSTLYLLSSAAADSDSALTETIKPYPRKWESAIMSTIAPLRLVPHRPSLAASACDVVHPAPALVFHTGGYTGNLYHAFLDGIIPLYITAAQFDRRVVFVVVKYKDWWEMKYHDILAVLSDFPPVDFSGDRRVHCFPGAVVGLRVHEELEIDAGRMPGGRSMKDFREKMEEAYGKRVRGEVRREGVRMVVVGRDGARGMENEGEVVAAGREVGMEVVVVKPGATTDLAEMYRVMNGTDVVVGVHGAALTHFLFMREGAVLVQIVPIGLAAIADRCFGKPARKMGLRYMKYEILPEESSLSRKYPKDDPVLTDADKIASNGWEITKELYINQTVRLDIGRFRKLLTEAYDYVKSKKSITALQV